MAKSDSLSKGTRTGTSTSAVEYSPGKKKRMAKARRKQDKYWASLAGPVTVTKIDQ